MRIVLLGTGDTVGTPKIGCDCPCCTDALAGGRSGRTRFSIMIETGDGRVLIDTGPDLRYQLIKHKISHVDGVVWTHGHYDHYAGFGEFYRVQDRVNVYGLSDTLDYILGYLYFMKPTRHDAVVYEPFSLIGLEFTLFPVHHPPLAESAGVVVSDGDKKLVITGDTTRQIPNRSIEIMRDPDILICDAIAPPEYDLRKHMNTAEAEDLTSELSAKKMVMTHLSHLFPPHDEAVKRWNLGYDGMEMIL
ncbi:MBL fold metallo-hydrolase [Methanosarcinales archaeon]|nr:MAG: MBL fold metallo-hydrolase [Methanosarcinales archaeon]